MGLNILAYQFYQETPNKYIINNLNQYVIEKLILILILINIYFLTGSILSIILEVHKINTLGRLLKASNDVNTLK